MVIVGDESETRGFGMLLAEEGKRGEDRLRWEQLFGKIVEVSEGVQVKTF